MDIKKEELPIDIKKKIIAKVVSHLASKDESLYYEPTINICQDIYNCIQKGSYLSSKEKELTIDLSPEDIQILLSYSSSCC